MQFIPLNDLPKVTQPPSNYVIIGAGKTGVDAVLWLLANDVDVASIQWIKPRDVWLIDRKNTLTSEEFFVDSIGAQTAQTAQKEAIAHSNSVDDMFARLENSRIFLRIETWIQTQIFRSVSIS